MKLLVAPAVVVVVVASMLAGASPNSDAWPLIEKAAALADGVGPSPLAERVRTLERQGLPLDDADVADSLDAIRAYAAAVDALDAANAASSCNVPKDLSPARTSMILKLADAALVTAVADAADGKPGRATAGVGRVADLAGVVARCAKPSLASAQLAISLGERARRVAWFLAEQRLVDVTKAQQIATGLAASAQSSILERVTAKSGVDEVGRQLDAAMRDQAALAMATSSPEAWEKIPRPARTVDVRCDAGKDEAHLTVTRAVAHALARKTADALAQDSVVGPSLDGRGILVVSAGPIARSCGFRDGDVVVEVNGISVARVDVALGQAPQQVAKDGYAAFRAVRHGGAVSEWRIDVAPN